jgi:hypothetical protein
MPGRIYESPCRLTLDCVERNDRYRGDITVWLYVFDLTDISEIVLGARSVNTRGKEATELDVLEASRLYWILK